MRFKHFDGIISHFSRSLIKNVELRPLSLSPSTRIMTLPDPATYYSFIRNHIQKSRHNITLSALYLGSGHLEKALVHDLRNALTTNPDLTLTVILDHSRAQRSPTPLAHLVDEFHETRVKVLLYQMPVLRGVLAKFLPSQICEVLGVYHCKFNLFDDDVLLSGANLSEEYFVNRQDRYVHISSEQKSEAGFGLCSMLRAFTSVVEPHCHQLLQGNAVREPCVSGSKGLREDLVQWASIPSTRKEGVSPDLPSPPFSSQAARTLLLPVLQHATIGVHHESTLIPKLFSKFPELLQLQALAAAAASPYPSILPSFAVSITKRADVKFIMSSPSSHGFASGRGFKSLVPLMHIQALRSALAEAGDQGTRDLHGGEQVQKVWAYDRQGWTFHAKGLWLWLQLNMSPTPPTHGSEEISCIEGAAHSALVSYIGSSNLGERSWKRDFELGFLICTCDDQVQTVLTSEFESIAKHAAILPQSESSMGIKLLTQLCRGFL